MVTEIFKTKIGFALDIMKEIFGKDNQNYKFQNDSLNKQHDSQLVYYCNEKASFIGPKIWYTLPKMQPH